MSNVFYFSNMSAERRAEIVRGCGFYRYNFGSATADVLGQKSTGFTAEQLDAMAGRYIWFTLEPVAGFEKLRFIPLREQFIGTEFESVFNTCEGSFKRLSIECSFNGGAANSAFERYKATCLDCGKLLNTEAAHTCDGFFCEDCGANITRDEWRAGRICRTCLSNRLHRVHGYHCRPNESSPKFERADKRADVLHLGAEIEIEGSRCFNYTERAKIERLSRCLNDYDHPEVPFVEFETDRSLDDGVECILRPMTFDGLNKRENDFATFYDTAKTDGGKFDKLNGMHFHLDRAFFGDEENRAKAAVLIDYMIFKYYDFFAVISGRHCDYTRYACKKDGIRGIMSAAARCAITEHSFAVNGSNKNTIEVRIFGGKIDSGAAFLAVADIVQAVGRWAKYTSFTAAAKHTPEALVKYLKYPARVAAYLDNLRADRYTTTAGEAMRATFADAVKKAAANK